MYPNNQPLPPQYPGPYQSPPPNQDPYSFITQAPQQPARNLGPTSTKGRIIIVAVAAVILIIIVVVVMSLLGNAGKAQTDQYVAIAKSQTEIIRISTLAEQKSRSLEGRSLALTTRLSFTTAQTDMKQVLATRSINEKALTKQLSASQNKKTNDLLAEAEKNNRYEETYQEIVKNEVANYKKLLRAAVGGATPKEKQTLEAAFAQANTLFPEDKAASTGN